MKIKTLNVGPLQCCCYVVFNEQSCEAIVIDPGGDVEIITDYIKKNKLKPLLLINTHGHGDHIGGNLELKEVFPEIKICIHADDEQMLTHPAKNLSFIGGVPYKSPPAECVLKHGDIVGVDGCKFKVLHTPGHTPGGICLLSTSNESSVGSHESKLKTQSVLFSGDTLFAQGIGRTDLPGGSQETLMESIRDKILTLDDNTIVYPGHGPSSTVAEEKANNPFIQAFVNE
ncbi:MAG: MBL fold metallo-hydrolase [Candidatus Brocadiales bacterium]